LTGIGGGADASSVVGSVEDGWKESEIEDDFIVMPLSCSSSLLSMYRSVPASLLEMIPLLAIRLSLNVVFPWSTCAITQTFRVVDMGAVSLRVFC
jgi:hypothetical protein